LIYNKTNASKDYSWETKQHETSINGLFLQRQVSVSEQFWFNLLALLFGMASINGLYPFGLAYTSASVLYRKKFVSACLFTLIGVLLTLRNFTVLRHLGAVLIFTLVFLFFKKLIESKSYLAGFLALLSNFTAGLVFLLLSEALTPYELILLTMESSIASLMMFIIPVGLPQIFKGAKDFGGAEKCICVSILAGVILSLTSGLQISLINLKDILGVLAVLVMASSVGPGAGAISGIIIGIMGYSFPFSPWSVSILAFAGLISGTFKRLGRIGTVTGFALGYLIYNFYINSIGETLINIPVILFSSGIFLVIPADLFNKLANNLKVLQEQKDGVVIPKLAEERLYEIASVISDMGTFFKEPLDGVNRADARRYFEDVCAEIQETVCCNCGMYKICWEREPRKTVKSLFVLIKDFEKNLFRAMPQLFKSRCKRVEDIKRIVSEKSSIYLMQKRLDKIIDFNRDLICAYFEKASEMIKELAAGISEELDMTLDDKLLSVLSQLGVRPENVFVTSDDNRCEISIVKPPCIGERQCETVIPKGIATILGRRFYTKIIDCPLKTGGLKCRLKAVTYGILGVCVGASGMAKAGQKVSGDKFTFMDLNNGKYMVALSDGMGVGDKASQHSERTLEVTERLLKAGFGSEFTLKMVNLSMMLSTQDESFSTLDLVIIDTYSGRAEFIKAGAPTSYIKRGNSISTVEGDSPPVGILNSISHTIAEKKLKPGDIIIMTSDGAIEAMNGTKDSNDMFLKIIKNLKSSQPQDICNEILDVAKSKGSCNDDITVLAIRISEKNA
jgi:stage II sporulation protein E